MYRQVFYTATATHPIGHLSDLDILRSARRNNPRAGITGFLLRSNTRFHHLLEGSPEAVDSLLQRIARDARCGPLDICLSRQVARRRLQDWTMGYASPQDTRALWPATMQQVDDWDGLLDLMAARARAHA